ncbi:MAG: cupin domain-containing protein [Gemmatimonadota bacterium]
MKRLATLAVFTVSMTFPLSAAAQQQVKQSGAAMLDLPASALTWSPLEIPGFVPGIKLAVLSGDPGQAGEAYTLRLLFPAGYAFPGHWHPNAENLTVLSGKFMLGMGEKTDAAKLKTYKPGDYLMIPGEMAHFGKVQGETVIQLHGMGPFAVTVTEQIAGAMK